LQRFFVTATAQPFTFRNQKALRTNFVEPQPLSDRIAAASSFIQKQRPDLRPKVGIIFGTGLSSLRSDFIDSTAIPYGDIPHFVTSTVESHAGELLLGRIGTVDVVAMRGRFHAYEG